MGEVLPFTAEHAEDVARLYFRSVRGQDRAAGTRLPEYFTSLHLSNPWASPDIAPWVYVEKGRVVGAIGILPRALEFDGKPLRIATVTLYMVHPENRNGLAGIQLLARVLKGPQDFSWSDGASGSVGELWKALGGHVVPVYAFNWTRILRPLGVARMGLDRAGKAGSVLRPLSGLVAAPGDFLLGKAAPSMFGAPVSPWTARAVSSDELWECIQEIGWREKLKPRYTAETLAWLTGQLAANRSGLLRMMCVSDPEGRRCGWFVYQAAPGGASFVLQIGVRRPSDFRNTLLALFKDAWQLGSVCVKGASIPQYLREMTELHCLFRLPHNRVVVHSRDPEIVSAVRTGEAALTRLEGIGWLRFPQESWTD